MSEKRVLIVDDDKALILVLKTRLGAYGYRVVFATDAVAAISIAQREKPDVIILDIGLPCGDGFMVMERLKDRLDFIGTPIIILSARDIIPNREKALKAGAIAFLQKPADMEELLRAIRKGLQEPQEASLEKPPSDNAAIQAAKKKVLIIADDQDLALALNVRFTSHGYRVVFATDATSSISAAQREKPDFIILDLDLPGGNGFMVIERLKFRLDFIVPPIIILSAGDLSPNKEKALKAGAIAFLPKPADGDRLFDAIRTAMAGTGGNFE
jgi:two-component system cell cycle response regulator